MTCFSRNEFSRHHTAITNPFALHDVTALLWQFIRKTFFFALNSATSSSNFSVSFITYLLQQVVSSSPAVSCGYVYTLHLSELDMFITLKTSKNQDAIGMEQVASRNADSLAAGGASEIRENHAVPIKRSACLACKIKKVRICIRSCAVINERG